MGPASNRTYTNTNLWIFLIVRIVNNFEYDPGVENIDEVTTLLGLLTLGLPSLLVTALFDPLS